MIPKVKLSKPLYNQLLTSNLTPQLLKSYQNNLVLLNYTKFKYLPQLNTSSTGILFQNIHSFILLRVNYFFTHKLYYKFFAIPSRKPTSYLLSLNFKRLRFFPGFRTTGNIDFTHLSLGLLSSYFRKGKFFLKSKIVYLALASFFRKLLIFSGIKMFFLHINRSPKYFLEILNTILEPVISTYRNPFNSAKVINEQQWDPSFIFHSVIFTNPKPYGKIKVKQRGRLKRKISSRVISLNRILD